MSAGSVRVDDVAAVAQAINESVHTMPGQMTPLGMGHWHLPGEVLIHVATDLLMKPSPALRTALRRALRPDMRVWRGGSFWWIAGCRVCGHLETASHHREALGLAYVHLLECRGALVEVPDGPAADAAPEDQS